MKTEEPAMSQHHPYSCQFPAHRNFTQPIFLGTLALATALFLLVPKAAQGSEPVSSEAATAEASATPPNFDYETMAKRAEAYFAAYESLDATAIAANYHDEMIFLDETAEAIGPVYHLAGKDNVHRAIEGFLPQVISLKVEFEERFFAGRIGVFRGVYHARVKGSVIGQAADLVFDVDYPVTAVLEFEDGLIRKHTDYIDYLKMAAELPTLTPVPAEKL